MDSQDDEILQSFIDESREHLADIEMPNKDSLLAPPYEPTNTSLQSGTATGVQGFVMRIRI